MFESIDEKWKLLKKKLKPPNEFTLLNFAVSLFCKDW